MKKKSPYNNASRSFDLPSMGDGLRVPAWFAGPESCWVLARKAGMARQFFLMSDACVVCSVFGFLAGGMLGASLSLLDSWLTTPQLNPIFCWLSGSAMGLAFSLILMRCARLALNSIVARAARDLDNHWVRAGLDPHDARDLVLQGLNCEAGDHRLAAYELLWGGVGMLHEALHGPQPDMNSFSRAAGWLDWLAISCMASLSRFWSPFLDTPSVVPGPDSGGPRCEALQAARERAALGFACKPLAPSSTRLRL